MDEVFKALADASRRLFLDQLHARNGQALGELCDGFDTARQAVTNLPVILEAANFIGTVKRGREKLHYFNPVPIHEMGPLDRKIRSAATRHPLRTQTRPRIQPTTTMTQACKLVSLTQPHDSRQTVGGID